MALHYLLELLSFAGLLLSAYAVLVIARSATRSYRPLCDVAARISCTKAFLSPHGRLLGVHNAWIGVLGYLVLFIMAARGLLEMVFVLSLAAALFSLYLAYVSYVEMRNFCLVCTSIYLINILLSILSYRAVF